MNFLIALILGAASAFAFEPFAWWPWIPLAFAGLCELIARAPNLKRALLLGWGFSVGQFCIGLNWIATAFTFQAAMPAWLGWIAVVLLSFYLAAFMMLAAGLAWKFGRERRLSLVLALAGGWAICEYLRGTMFTGFAWNPVGVAMVDTPWRESSATIGIYGLSLLTVLAGGIVWLAWWREWRAPIGFGAVLLLLLALPDPIVFDSQPNGLQVFDAARRAPAPPTAPPSRADGAPADPGLSLGPFNRRIRIVQPNIGQADKWREGFDEVAAQRLASLSQRPYPRDHGPAALLFWPEAAVTEPLSDERRAAAPFIDNERARAVRSLAPGAILVTGGLGLNARDGVAIDGVTNSVFVLDHGGRMKGRYDKAHLVPYGEYLPMRPILAAIGLSRLAPGDLDFADGPGPRTIDIAGVGRMGLQICYEIIFSGQVVDRRNRPTFLFNPSNDAWFGAWGPPQHLAQARLRAAEEGLPVIRSTPTGISALIDAQGRLLQSIALGSAGIIDATLPPPAAKPTPFSRLGNIIPLGLAFLLVFAAIALARGPRYRQT